jgi:hypothetical protein
MSCGQKVTEPLVWFATALGIVVALGSLDAFVVDPTKLELEIIDLLMGPVIAGTLGAIGRVCGRGGAPRAPVHVAAIRASAPEPRPSLLGASRTWHHDTHGTRHRDPGGSSHLMGVLPRRRRTSGGSGRDLRNDLGS